MDVLHVINCFSRHKSSFVKIYTLVYVWCELQEWSAFVRYWLSIFNAVVLKNIVIKHTAQLVYLGSNRSCGDSGLIFLVLRAVISSRITVTSPERHGVLNHQHPTVYSRAIQAHIKEASKIHITGLLSWEATGESTVDRWIPLTGGFPSLGASHMERVSTPQRLHD